MMHKRDDTLTMASFIGCFYERISGFEFSCKCQQMHFFVRLGNLIKYEDVGG